MKTFLLLLLTSVIFLSCNEPTSSGEAVTRHEAVRADEVATPLSKGEAATHSKGEAVTHPKDDKFDYETSWKEVKNTKNLPKSRLKIVETIYKNAKKYNNDPQLIKAIIYKMNYMQQVEEDTLVKVHKLLLNEIKEAKSPRKQILSSMLAEQYWNYYKQNRWKFLNRTKVANIKQYDMKTWTLDKIIKETEKYYKLSLGNSQDLKKIKIDDYASILYERKDTRKFHPTVYDFLIYRAIDFYSNNQSSLTKPAYYFTLSGKKYLSNSQDFIKLKIESKDVENFQYIAIKLFQDWAKSHVNDSNKEVLIDLELKRLEFVYTNGVILNKKLIYETLLKNLAEKYKKEDISAEINHRLALLYLDLANNYNPNISNKYKDYRKKAHNLCTETIKSYPNSFGAMNCKKTIKGIESKSLKLVLESTNPINRKFKGLLEYKNINKVYIKVVKTNFEEYKQQRNRYKKMINYYNDKKASLNFSLNLPNDKDFNSYKTEIPFNKLAVGKYIVMLSDDDSFNPDKNVIAYNELNVTNISYLIKNSDKNGLELYLKDSDIGKSLKNVRLDLYQNVWSRLRGKYILEKKKTLKTNAKGYIKTARNILKYNNFYINFRTNTDSYFPNKSFYSNSYYSRRKHQIKTFYFTDRKIYRPGQTLYFKALVVDKYNFEGEKTKTLKNTPKTITLYDPNGQKVSSLNLRTNNFGTISGTFIIPTDRLNGQYYLSDGYDTYYISIEEYKRPKFEVKFKKANKEFKLNQEVEAKGFAKAYAGFNIDSAKVKYRVVRTTYYPYSWYWYGYYPSSPSVEITNGYTKTDAKGEFTIKFEAIPDLSVDKSKKPAFRYTIHADVTDSNGETRSSSKTISLGYTSLVLDLDLNDSIDRENLKETIKIHSSNLNGEFVKAKGNIKIYKLKTPDKLYRTKKWAKANKFLIDKKTYKKDYIYDEYKNENSIYKWEKENLLFTAPFDTAKSKKISLKHLNKWKTGKYIIEAYSKDKFGNEIKDVKYFTVFDSKAKKAPYKNIFWTKKLSKTTKVGEKAEYLIATSDKDVHILYQIERRGKITSKELILNNEQKKISIAIKEKDRGNFFVNFIFIKHNRVFSYNDTVYVPWDNKELKISFETFRNKLLPGQKEEWKLKITGNKKDKVMAEMLATLYDASLDAFRANNWWISLFPSLYQSHVWRAEFNTSYSNYIGYYTTGYGHSRKYYDMLNWFGFYWRTYYHRRYKYKKSAKRAFGGMIANNASNKFMTKSLEDDSVVDEKAEAPMPVAEAKEEGDKLDTVMASPKMKERKDAENNNRDKNKQDIEKPIKLRTNFNETAFFYPHLKTDKNGNVIISFTAPESLTKWKMLGFAHTKDLKYGFTQNELVTQKDLMVIPNAPRFLRSGDKIIFTAKITNLTDKELKGKAKLMLFDAITMKPIDNLFKNINIEQNFTAKKGKSPILSWELSVPDNIDAVTYRITAQSGDFSDGEEMAIPILKNRMLVTESLPLPIRAKQTKTFKFKKLINSKNSKTLKNHKLTLEFTSNPVWYAVQALPYLMEYPYECNEQTFSRYYANSLASYIVNSNPKIKKVFDIWKATNSKELISNLEKNQELKSVILKETPWVRDAYSETEQKHRIALLFDLNKMSNKLKKALNKLKNAQESDGGWPWFKGGYTSRWVTQYIVTGFAHLSRLKVIDIQKNTVVNNMLRRAIPYLDRQIKIDYDNLITYQADLNLQHISYFQIQYFYARSYFKDIFKLDSSSKTAFDYYFAQAQKFWPNFNKYSQGMIALFLNRYKDSKTANKIMDSIKEHFIESEEMGLYFKESYGYYWYNMPIETHALLVEAFDEIKNDAKTIDGLKTWLLKSKQTQNWKTTKATVNAIYALLLRGGDWLKESKQADITIGNYKITYKPILQKSPYVFNEKLNKKLRLKYVKPELGTGYIKTSWKGDAISPEMGEITVKNNNNLVAWGAVYWQYFEDLDKITFAKTPLVLHKKLFVERNSDKGPILKPLTKDEKITIGDRIKVRITLKVDRDMEYVHMKDMRASNLEPENVISRYKWQDGLGYYESTKDASTDFFFDYLHKGTYVFEYPLRITHKGNFSNGITTIQSMYAPEFTSHSEGVRIEVK